MSRFLLMLILVFPFYLFANSPIQSTDPEKAEIHAALLEFIESKEFVLEANTFYDRYGRMSFVSPNSNFFLMSNEEAVLQIAFNNGRLGPNGLGGITLEGRVSKYEVKDRGVGKGVHLKMNFEGTNPAHLILEISDNGNAIIFYSGHKGERIRLKGALLDIEESNVFMGSATY